MATMVGFDIGAEELKIVQWNGSRVVRTASAPTPDNLISNGQIVSYEVMADLIKETVKKEHITGRSCSVILPSTHAFLRRITTPAMSVDQLLVNLPYEFRDFLTMDKEKYYYDYAVNSTVTDEDGTPTQLDLTACAVPKEVIAQYRAMFRRAGFKLKTAIPAECAYANLVSRFGSESQERCVIDLGHTATRIHIFVGSTFETTRVIDMGVGLLVQAISDGLGVDEHVAHTYVLTNHEGVLEKEGAANLYQAITMDIRKTINFYGFNHRDSQLQDAWCIGGGAQIAPLLETIRQSLDLTLHTSSELITGSGEDSSLLSSFAGAIGAAIQ